MLGLKPEAQSYSLGSKEDEKAEKPIIIKNFRFPHQFSQQGTRKTEIKTVGGLCVRSSDLVLWVAEDEEDEEDEEEEEEEEVDVDEGAEEATNEAMCATVGWKWN